MISTSSYKGLDTPGYLKVSISMDRGASAGYSGKCYLDLAPKRGFWDKWRKNIGVVSEEENTRFYIEEYYKQVLSKLDPLKVYKDLEYSTLLCYEDSEEFCHRHVVAAWFNLLLGNTIQPVMEVAVVDGLFTCVGDCSSKYINILEDVIKNNEKMYGFTSVRARYLFNKGEELEALADKKEAETGDCYDSLRQSACYYRCDADEAEAEYKALQYRKEKGAQ